MLKIIKNKSILYTENNILADIYYTNKKHRKVVLFLHGFKGFKDWGAWDLVAKRFAEAGYIFVAFNFSHNGIGQEHLNDFTRLDLFFKNNYSKELDNVQTVLKWINQDVFWDDFNVEDITIIGHSRGGGIALVSAAEQSQINRVITWASISQFNRFGNQEELEKWKEKGFKNFYNGRTNQDMKISYDFYTDYEKNIKRLDIEKAVRSLNKPQLILHGTADTSVGFSHAQRLKKWNENATLVWIDEADHVFGAKHPYNEDHLPDDLQQVVDKSLSWISLN